MPTAAAWTVGTWSGLVLFWGLFCILERVGAWNGLETIGAVWGGLLVLLGAGWCYSTSWNARKFFAWCLLLLFGYWNGLETIGAVWGLLEPLGAGAYFCCLELERVGAYWTSWNL